MPTHDLTRALLRQQLAELLAILEGDPELLARVRAALAPEHPPALLDRAGLARELATSPGTVDRLRREGLPEVRVGDQPRFELGAVLAWLRRREGRAAQTSRVPGGRRSSQVSLEDPAFQGCNWAGGG